MPVLPMKAVLFWIAVALAPPDTSQILVKGPDSSMAWTKQTAGWSLSTDRSLWNAEENTVSASAKGTERKREADVASYVKGVKDHDWKESATLKLPSGASLAKEGETYAYTLDEGSDTAKRYVIRFRRNPAAAKAVVQLGYVGKTSDDKRSFADSGHAVVFDRPADAKYLSAIQIYASRYGLPQPPQEDFHVYVLDKDQKVVQDFLFPYSLIPRGQQRWYTLDLPATEVPERFFVALAFNAEPTKGIYLGLDRNVKESHSYSGLPGDGYQPIPEKYDWMVRARLVSDPNKTKSRPGSAQGRPAPATAQRAARAVGSDFVRQGSGRGDAPEPRWRCLGRQAESRRVRPCDREHPLQFRRREGRRRSRRFGARAQVEGVKYVWDKKVAFEGQASLCIAKTANRYFPIAQWSQTVDRTGDLPCLEVSAQVKAAKMSKAVLDVVFLDKDGEWISHHWAAYVGSKEAGDPPADHEWKKYFGTVEIPPKTAKICVALQDYGPGKVWFDDIRARYAGPAEK